MGQQHLDFGTAAANDGEYIRTAFPKIDDNFDELYGVQGLTANISTSAVKTANTAAIQAAIDAAYADARTVVFVPAGVYYCDPGIYLDAPGNLRTSLSTPTIFNFSLHLHGAGGLGNHEGFGTQLRFTDVSTNALIVGTGQGMRVSELGILGPHGATSRAALSANGIGIALAGGSGGLSRCLIDNVMVDNFRQGIVSGFNAATLCDAVTLFKCHVSGCYRGLHISQTQNYINSLIDCVFTDCTTHVYSPVGKAVNIVGGNYSTTNANKAAFTIGSTSALTSTSDSFAGSEFTNWTFTTTLSSDDQPMIDGAYDAFVIKTVGFGVIPLVLTNYNSSTRVATLKFYVGWLTSHYPGVNIKTVTDIETELAAATLLYACETVTPFFGTGISVDGSHIENPAVLTRLITTETAFQGDRSSRVSKTFFNYYINQADLAAGTNAQKAVFYCQQVFPFVRVVQSSLVLEDLMLTVDSAVGLGLDGVNVEVVGNSVTHRLIVRNCDFYHPNITLPVWGPNSADNAYNWPTMARGAGEWDSTPFLPGAETARYYGANRVSHVAFRGWNPEPSASPRIRASVFSALTASPPGSLGTYPSLHGGTLYSIIDETSGGPSAAVWGRSAHAHFSYGQDLTIDWSYKGKTHVVTLSALTRMYAGLKITLDNGGGDKSYIVTGVYPTLGYVTVINLTDGLDQLLAGTKTTTYNASTVKQESYSIARSGNLPLAKSASNTTAGATTAAVGDLTGAAFVNLLITAVGAANLTTRTAAEMFGDIPGCYVDFFYMLSIKNTNAGTTTLAAGSNVTITGTATIAQNTTRLFHVTFPTATTCTITSLGVTATV